jgi:O-antigen ligase
MSARGTLAWKGRDTSVSKVGWLARGLERLALAAFIITILLLGYWNVITPDWFAKSWDIGGQYQLVTLFNSRLQSVILFPSDIAAATAIVFWGLGRIVASITHQERAPLRFGPRCVVLPLIGLAALSALSATQAILAILSLEIALHLLLVAALVIAVINLRPPLWAIVAPLALLLACEGALSVAQALAQSTLLGDFPFNLGLTTVASQPEASIVQLPNGARWLRAYGTFPHPNILGGFLCLAIPVVAGAYLRQPRRRGISWLLLASLALGLLALFLSFSRAAWLGIVISALWAGLLLWQKRRAASSANKFAAKSLRPHRWLSRFPANPNVPGAPAQPAERVSRRNALSGEFIRRNLRSALPALLSVGLLVGLVAALGPVVQSRLLLNNAPLEQRSLDERVVLLEAGALFFTQHPWLGVGAGNMPLVELSYPPTRNIGEPAHNVPVAVAVETGLFGLLLWLIPPLGALWLAWRRRAVLSAAGLTASAVLVALLTVAQLDHYLWTQPVGSLIWWLAVALSALWGERSSSEAPTP